MFNEIPGYATAAMQYIEMFNRLKSSGSAISPTMAAANDSAATVLANYFGWWAAPKKSTIDAAGNEIISRVDGEPHPHAC